MASRNRNTAGTASLLGHARADQTGDHGRLERAEPAGRRRDGGDRGTGEVRRADLGEVSPPPNATVEK